jgi:hypothetical protein
LIFVGSAKIYNFQKCEYDLFLEKKPFRKAIFSNLMYLKTYFLENGLKNAFPKVVIEAFSNPEINDMTEP